MKVYLIVVTEYHQCSDVVAIYSNLELAEQAKVIIKDRILKSKNEDYYGVSIDDYEIDDVPLDSLKIMRLGFGDIN